MKYQTLYNARGIRHIAKDDFFGILEPSFGLLDEDRTEMDPTLQ